ncbi:MAG: ATP-binding protein [Muribaculaceae bacterium]|nr:ATP-binding protein [Muribaculaceae bacterium]
MRRLCIKNFGPLKDAILDLGQVNVITGQQSSGKSCVLKTACYCAWVEKRIELQQSDKTFREGSAFIDRLVSYYNMTGYIKSDTFIEYETGHIKFSYDNIDRSFRMTWKSNRWNYKRPKVSYIPADRNLAAAIPGWSSLPLDMNLLEFMSNWDQARKSIGKEDNILGLGMSYRFDKQSHTDHIQLPDGQSLMLKESSSGIQSLFPMFVHLDYITKKQYEGVNTKLSYEQKEERKKILEILHDRFVNPIPENIPTEKICIDGVEFNFLNKKDADTFHRRYSKYTNVDHSEIFLEEPEDNLFPPTQCQLVNWLIEAIKKHDDMLFVATHSPYILNQFIKDDPEGLTIFFTHRESEKSNLYSVRQLNAEEIQEIYDNGVDLFFNFEAYI